MLEAPDFIKRIPTQELVDYYKTIELIRGQVASLFRYWIAEEINRRNNQ